MHTDAFGLFWRRAPQEESGTTRGQMLARVELHAGRRCVTYARIPPAPQLADIVRSYEYCDAIIDEGASLPWAVSIFPVVTFYLGVPSRAFEYESGAVRLLPRAITLGPCDHRVAELVDNGRSVNFTVVFQPTGFFRLFHISPAEIRNHAYDCADVLGAQIAGLHERLCGAATPFDMAKIVDEALILRLHQVLAGSQMQRAAAVLLQERGGGDLTNVAQSLGFSDSSWRRHFIRQIGVTPKLYQRMLRFQYAVSLKKVSPGLSWTKVCHHAGYYDQSHFIAEFRELCGSAPSEFLREIGGVPPELISHYGIDRNIQSAG